jgi:hypothetical protein
MSENYLNVWSTTGQIPEKVNLLSLTISGDIDKDSGKKWKAVNGVVNALLRKGFAATHTPLSARQKLKGDICVLSEFPIDVNRLIQNIPRIVGGAAEISESAVISSSELPTLIESAWQNWFREILRLAGFLHLGMGTYTPSECLSQSTAQKPSFRISAELVGGNPALWIDPETRVMIPLTYAEAALANEENPLPVRVLMDWKSAFLMGVHNENVSQFREYDLTGHWAFLGVPINPSQRVYKVRFGDQPTTYSYPETCVFKEYVRGKKETGGRKIPPAERIARVQNFLNTKLQRITFLGANFTFSLEPTKAKRLNYEMEIFESGRTFQALLRKGISIYPTNLFNIKSALEKGAEPYTGKQNGNYVVICPEELSNKIDQATKAIEKEYQQLNMGYIKQYLPTFFVKGNKYNDYTEGFNLVIQDILAKSSNTKNIIAFVVLPDVSWESAIYFQAKSAFFNPSSFNDDVKPMQIQCLATTTIDKIIADKYYIVENIIPQVYLKLFGKNAALWLSKTPADAYVYPLNRGVTAYACFDVSRRKKLKSQVSVFTAVTDGYGRFISFDSIPSGGERLTDLSFYNLIERIATMCKSYANQFAKLEPNLPFNLQRIVLYKDGRMDYNEKAMMARVFNVGIPEEGREPLQELFSKRKDLPEKLALDIISVNKSANRRIFSNYGGNWQNLPRGTYCGKNNEGVGLLVSSQVRKFNDQETMTVKPLQLELIHHFTVNSNLSTPSIKSLAQEYYHLTCLDWVSFYQKSKFALPQRITQKTGEFLSAQVNVPKGVVVL